jgi:hypothetical protein
MVAIDVLPLPEPVVEGLNVVDHHAIKELVELLGVDAMRALDLAIQSFRRSTSD